MPATDTRTDAEILADVEAGLPLKAKPTAHLRTAIAEQAVAADPGVWDDKVTLGRRILAARLRDRGGFDVEAVMNACTRAIRAEYGSKR